MMRLPCGIIAKNTVSFKREYYTYMKKLNRRTKQWIVLGVCAAAVLLLIIFLVRGVTKIIGGKADTSEGLKYIQQEEAGEISKIEEKISLLEQQDSSENDERSIKEKFDGAVILGDSIAEGFEEYDVLNASSVVAKIGVHLNELDDQIEQVKELSPRILFLSLGMNDVASANGDADAFVKSYKAVVEQIQSEVPDTHIFVNAVFPVQQKVIDEEAAYENIPEYNEALKKMCESMQIGYIDNSEIVEETYYEEDGIHFKASFYPIWAEHMAEVANL